jgi:hypothetical protein
MKARKIAPKSPLRRERKTRQAKARQARRLGSWSVSPNDLGLAAKCGIRRDALLEQRHQILLFRANKLGIRAEKSLDRRWATGMRRSGADPPLWDNSLGGVFH